MIANSCSNCKKQIIFGIGEVVTLQVQLLETKRNVIFCSKQCMENKLSNLNANTTSQFEHVEIKEQKTVSENPLIVFVKLEPKPIKTEIISIT